MKTYEDGLREAWDLAQKIVLPRSTRADAYTAKELEAIFGEGCYENVLSLSFDDVQKHLSAPKVGNVYAQKYDDKTIKCIVTCVVNNDIVNYIKSDGKTGTLYLETFVNIWKYTGDNLCADIAPILYKLGGKTSV